VVLLDHAGPCPQKLEGLRGSLHHDSSDVVGAGDETEGRSGRSLGAGARARLRDAAVDHLADVRLPDRPLFARAELTESLVNPSNGYSALRLSHYATDDASDWNRLPEWNPPAEPIAAAELDAPGGASATQLATDPAPLPLPASVTSPNDPALLALGKAAFERYPAQLAQYLRVGLTSRTAAARAGLWVDDGQGVAGLVRAEMADGSVAVALTCSSCHAAALSGGGISPGTPNAALDLGAAILAAQGISAAG
jgi:hypothetical protein